MDWFTGIIVFLLIWWTALFAVLPWGNRAPDEPEEGMAASAPERPRIGIKFVVTTGISVVIWCVIYILIENQAFDFHEMANEMSISNKNKDSK